MLVAFAVAQFFAGPILGNLGDRFGRRPVLLASMLAFGARLCADGVRADDRLAVRGRVVAGHRRRGLRPGQRRPRRRHPARKARRDLRLMGAAFGVGFIIGPAIGGLLAQFGPRAPFYAAAALALRQRGLDRGRAARDARRPRTAARSTGDAPMRSARSSRCSPPAAPRRCCVVRFLWQLAHMVYPATWAFWAEMALRLDAGADRLSLAASGAAMALVQISSPAARSSASAKSAPIVDRHRRRRSSCSPATPS